ncbi:MAG: methylmalonyl Co-A mutase-associated GTPase MeaB, partial [Candidatus Aminicenantaceae bacterium]
MMSDLTTDILKGDHRALAKAISIVEDRSNQYQEIMKRIFPYTGGSLILGVTGAPGTGKSTIIDRLIGDLRKEEKKIGVIAVDPSSPFTGGAVLGDRVRMMSHSVDREVFIRSMATRGNLGGLSESAGEVIALMEAAGKDFILLETVGVGQDEVEVVKLADIIIVVLMPGAGDEIQIYKAGIMEIADIFILNKADSPEAVKTETQLKAMREFAGKKTEIVKTIATEGKGIEILFEKINECVHTRSETFSEIRKKRLISSMLKEIIGEKLFRIIDKGITTAQYEDM